MDKKDKKNIIKKNNTKKKKEVKYKEFDIKKYEKVYMGIGVIVGIVFLILLFMALKNEIFLPAALIAFALELFCICYYYLEDEKKKPLVYTLFSLGVLLIVIEVIFTIVKAR